MIAYPIILRELIVRARLPQTHWVRACFALIGLLVSLQYFLLGYGVNLVQVGGYAFQSLAWLSFLGASCGFMLTADSVSSERRDGTLGLLFLTRVGISDVMAGKLASAGIGAMLGLAAIAPVLMLPVLAGGVKGVQVVKVVLSLPGILFLSLCVGVWSSSRCLRMGQSIRHALVLMALMVALPLLIGGFFTPIGSATASQSLQCLSPGAAFLWASGSAAMASSPFYWFSLGVGFAEGALLLASAARSVKRKWQEEEFSGPNRRWRPQGIVRVNDGAPIEWLLRRSKTQSRAIWLGLALLVVPRAAVFVLNRVGISGIGANTALGLLCSAGSALVLSYAGAAFFLEARQTGSLELLLTTPEGSRRMLADQRIILRRRLVRPILLMLFVSVLLSLPFWTRGMFQVPQTILGLIGSVFDVFALCWLGVWFGYSARSTWTALLWCAGLVTGLDLVTTYAVYALFGVVLSGVGFRGGWGNFMVMVLTSLPALVCITKQIWLIRWSHRRLQKAFSVSPLQPFEFGQSIKNAVEHTLTAVQKARHWTGGDR